MSEPATPPEECTSMAQVRAGVDATDMALVSLLAQRFAYMRAAARIKPEREAVRDELRKAEVITQVQAQARALGLPDAVIGEIWDMLVEASIAYELAEFDRIKR